METNQITRACKKCGITKPLSEFQRYSETARRHACKSCNTARVEAWQREHRTERQAKARVRYQADPSAYWTPERRARANELAKVRNAVLRDEVLAVYGRQCSCCGEEQPKFLTIDHIANDGMTMREVHGTGTSFYRWLIKQGFPKGFQTLCMNCNFGKARNGGFCPHVSIEGSTTIP